MAGVGCRALAAASRYRPLGIEPKSLMTSARGSGWTRSVVLETRRLTRWRTDGCRTAIGPRVRIAALAAIQGVKICAPFALPPEQYAAWKTVTWEFDPHEMK